jgi:hypothetical protein
MKISVSEGFTIFRQTLQLSSSGWSLEGGGGRKPLHGLDQFWLTPDCNNGHFTWRPVSVSARRSHWAGNLQVALITITTVTLVKGRRS